MCFHKNHQKLYYKCLNSDDYYTATYVNGELRFSKFCIKDPYGYQACHRLHVRITNADVLCGGYICNLGEQNKHKFIECTGDACKSENRNCDISRQNTGKVLCDDKCESSNYCIDESYCNGHTYGVICDTMWIGRYVPVHWVCNGRKDCKDGSDENICNVTGSSVITCTHYWTKVGYGVSSTVPIHENTRCSVFGHNTNLHPYCLDYLDQTNCSDIERVGGYCEINGYWSSVSKYMVCFEHSGIDQMCDDDFQNNCVHPSTSDCHIHKHLICDGISDCPDQSDENPQFCKTMTLELNKNFVCIRRFQPRIGETRIPLFWIMDNEVDCMNGEDENLAIWGFCLENKAPYQKNCKIAFLCPGVNLLKVRLDYLCNRIESCGDGVENEICRIARDFPDFKKVAQYDGTARDVCQNSSNCEQRDFTGPWSPGEVFGVKKITLYVPKYQISCKDLFGEHYLFLSCMGLCSEENITCLLNRNSMLLYNSCPGQFPDRVITLADNSFLTFANKSNRGGYHQEFYQCENSVCIEFKQVCNLVDDCGDMSDELNCTNHMICEDSENSTKLNFISLSQKCDGIYDCFDLSDECH